MTQRAQQQLVVLHTLDRGELRMAEAADLLGLSTRQVRRLRRAYRRRGPKAVVHGNRGRRSPRRVREVIRKNPKYYDPPLRGFREHPPIDAKGFAEAIPVVAYTHDGPAAP